MAAIDDEMMTSEMANIFSESINGLPPTQHNRSQIVNSFKWCVITTVCEYYILNFHSKTTEYCFKKRPVPPWYA